MAWAPRWHPQAVRGARNVDMRGQRGQTPDLGHPVLPSPAAPRLGEGPGGGGGGGGVARP